MIGSPAPGEGVRSMHLEYSIALHTWSSHSFLLSHVTPPVVLTNPSLHVQVREPGVLVHVAYVLQPPL
jgi:hypothetical protein